MGIKVSKKTVLKILKENGFVPPRVRFFLTLTAEHLVNPEGNPFYDSANSLAITIQNESEDDTVIIVISELTMINRIAPERLTKTMYDLNIGAARILYKKLNGSN